MERRSRRLNEFTRFAKSHARAMRNPSTGNPDAVQVSVRGQRDSDGLYIVRRDHWPTDILVPSSPRDAMIPFPRRMAMGFEDGNDQKPVLYWLQRSKPELGPLGAPWIPVYLWLIIASNPGASWIGSAEIAWTEFSDEAPPFIAEVENEYSSTISHGPNFEDSLPVALAADDYVYLGRRLDSGFVDGDGVDSLVRYHLSGEPPYSPGPSVQIGAELPSGGNHTTMGVILPPPPEGVAHGLFALRALSEDETYPGFSWEIARHSLDLSPEWSALGGLTVEEESALYELNLEDAEAHSVITVLGATQSHWGYVGPSDEEGPSDPGNWKEIFQDPESLAPHILYSGESIITCPFMASSSGFDWTYQSFLAKTDMQTGTTTAAPLSVADIPLWLAETTAYSWTAFDPYRRTGGGGGTVPDPSLAYSPSGGGEMG